MPKHSKLQLWSMRKKLWGSMSFSLEAAVPLTAIRKNPYANTLATWYPLPAVHQWSELQDVVHKNTHAHVHSLPPLNQSHLNIEFLWNFLWYFCTEFPSKDTLTLHNVPLFNLTMHLSSCSKWQQNLRVSFARSICYDVLNMFSWRSQKKLLFHFNCSLSENKRLNSFSSGHFPFRSLFFFTVMS